MRALLPLVAVLLAGCGGSPSSPTQPAPLASGRYALRIESVPTQLSSGGSASSAIFACAGRPDNLATVLVDLSADGAGWRGTAAGSTLVFTLQRRGEDLCGVVGGTATATDGTVLQFGRDSIVKSSSSDDGLCGRVASGGLAGAIAADVTFLYSNTASAASFGSCNGNSFTLTPR
jgi:hypothetical protein